MVLHLTASIQLPRQSVFDQVLESWVLDHTAQTIWWDYISKSYRYTFSKASDLFLSLETKKKKLAK